MMLLEWSLLAGESEKEEEEEEKKKEEEEEEKEKEEDLEEKKWRYFNRVLTLSPVFVSPHWYSMFSIADTKLQYTKVDTVCDHGYCDMLTHMQPQYVHVFTSPRVSH